MSAVIDAMWQQIEPTVFITRAEFERDLEGWTIEPVEHEGALAFAVVTRGPEFHFASFGRGVPITLRMIRDHVDPLLDRYGFARTRTPKDAERQQRLNKKLGFVEDGADDFFLYYRLDVPVWRRGCP